jgi:hypothetical protein
MANAADNTQLLLGRGKVYFDRKVAGAFTGLRFMGNCTSFEVQTNDTLKDIYSAAEAAAPLLKRVNSQRIVEVTIEFTEFGNENMALALQGDESTQVSVATPVVAEVQTAHLDKSFQLGATVVAPARDVTAVAVKHTSGSPTYVANTDYFLDAVHGMIYIPATGGAITEAQSLKVDYTPSATTYKTTKAGITGIIEGAMRYLGDPATGPKWDIQIWLAQLSPDGPISLIGTDYASAKLKATIEADAVNHPGESLYRATKLP